MPVAALFPGQASQTPDMRAAVAARRPDLLELACEAAGDDPFARADEDTRFAQPAILCASLAGWDELRERLPAPPAALAGHSLGELSALAAAGVVAEADAVRLAALRGRLMSEAGGGTMVAALGGDAGAVEAIARRHGLVVANDNAPGQLVLSGPRPGAAAAAAELRAGGVRALELNVSGAFHSPLMAPAAAPFAAALERVALRAPRLEVWSSLTAAPIDDPRRRLVEALTRPVRWRETVLALRGAGIDEFEETGPGRVLTKLVRRTLPGAARAA
ncbi:MAG TPA: ACP S-malonyltransferase [Solirubrobacteraceae bacterium]|nr:ACP S-malonyltransferase [Solirubrobacteraceae bacterium]